MDFNEYLEKRYEPQIKWYDEKSIRNHFKFNLFQSIIIVGSSCIPVLSATLQGHYRWITVTMASGVAALIGLTNLFKYQEKWIRHRGSCERLKREQYYFQLGIYEYHNLPVDQRQQLFVERVEQLISNEQSDWVREHGRRVDNLDKLLK